MILCVEIVVGKKMKITVFPPILLRRDAKIVSQCQQIQKHFLVKSIKKSTKIYSLIVDLGNHQKKRI